MKKIKNFYTDVYSFFVLKKNLSRSAIERIYSLLRVDNTFKTTSFNRMNDLNKIMKKYIKKFLFKKIILCDVGISSGQTTLELYNDLKNVNIKEIYGFDKNLNIKIYQFKKFVFLYSSKNELLMVEYDKHCVRYRYFYVLKKVAKLIIYFFKFLKIGYTKSNMLMPNLDKIEKIKFFEQNIFDIEKKYYNFFDVIRVSNLLNYSYFSEHSLKLAISNLKKISKEKCIILVNRTTDKNKNIGSFFIKKKGKFELLEDINGGSEIKDIMLS
ncbi:hypothetical protein [Candidatus Pelagibacter sp. HIMB1587]|uniref:hypothetical protein n=1 Tax=Candidatus Pelagibacter sp. HIMB1587 TaxID=3413354 RepID=UPI003F8674BE